MPVGSCDGGPSTTASSRPAGRGGSGWSNSWWSTEGEETDSRGIGEIAWNIMWREFTLLWYG